MPLTYRRGTLADSQAAFNIFYPALVDLGNRINVMAITDGDKPDVLANLWPSRRPLFDHLANTAEHFWIAEKDGEPIGYARSILRDGSRELTEFFVLPSHQSGGVGTELLARAFPADGASHRIIIATIDARAQARYLKAGIYPRFPIYYFGRQPEPVNVPTDLVIEPIQESPDVLAALERIDQLLVGHRRTIDLAWLLNTRTGFAYKRDGRMVGYGFTGKQRGPFALLNAADFPAVLAHAETLAHARGLTEFGFEVPLINEVAVQYLLKRGYRMDEFFAMFMSDKPFGKFENYIVTSPPFFF